MDREEESVCCQEIPACVSINQESAEFEGTAIPECITDNCNTEYMFIFLGIATCLESISAAVCCKSF